MSFLNMLAAWCRLPCHCQTKEGKRWSKVIIGTGRKTDTHVHVYCNPRKWFCFKQWEKRYFTCMYIYNQPFTSFLFHCLSFVLFKYMYNIWFLNFYSCKAAEDDELGPDGKRLRPGISSKIIEELTDCNAALSQQRKRRQVL